MTALETSVVTGVRPANRTPEQIAREFRDSIAGGARLLPVGEARRDPAKMLLTAGYGPRHRIDLFDTTYYLTNARQNPDLRFFVAYVVLGHQPRALHPRIFYKDISLVWRSASHFVRSAAENWIGKGDVRTRVVDGEEILESAEETTDLPLELQTALETLSREGPPPRTDHRAVDLVLRRGPDDRLAPYADFTRPRARAQADPNNRIHRGRSIARFTRKHEPESLVFAKGFEPDFRGGVLERDTSTSRIYGGRLRRFRILSQNRKVQYLFFAGPQQVWIAPPQATTTEISSYGVRTVDVITDPDLCIPGYEYHFVDDGEDPPALYTQIPEGFAGLPCELDPSRADTSPWNDRMPVVRAFRRALLKQRRR